VVPVPEEGLGLEASGIVSRVGPEVRELCLGDRVILLGYGTLSTLVITTERLCEKIPSNLSFEDAATMPTVFTTAVCCLLNIGNLQKGQVSACNINNLRPQSNLVSLVGPYSQCSRRSRPCCYAACENGWR
jgi:NADPH:quinone reductase-like Zn-dependent oxidoreductase